jgi:release factor glutamine methyltransferase
MQIREALRAAGEHLAAHDVGSPRLNAEVLLMFVLGCDRAHLFAHPERELTADEQARYDAVIRERTTGKPTQYITGHQEFWGMDFVVSPAVLIPRPETEHVVETALELARAVVQPRIVDVGTGSGCIALALAKELPQAEVLAVDISAEALEVAHKNASQLGLERVHFRQGDLLERVEAASFDLVVSNPPYVGEAEPEKAQREVREFEPKVAVFAGPQGMEVYERLIPQAARVLRPGGWLVMEIGYSIEEPVRALMSEFGELKTVPDLQGIPRVVAGKRD